MRKRHSGVDTQGNLIHITVHKANDTGAGCRVFKEMLQKYPTLKEVCADAGYGKPMEEFVRTISNKYYGNLRAHISRMGHAC
ncbi:transposase [Holospora elegans]|uniref:transposase n=1 Tax=Holospora elegans TaxID=431043 RepID=UPI0035714F2A